MARRADFSGDRDPARRQSAVQERIRAMLVLERLCTRFPRVLAQLRAVDGLGQTREPIDEARLTGLLHALLLIDHEDVRPVMQDGPDDESATQIGLLLKIERILFVPRVTAAATTEAELEQHVASDVETCRQSLDCRTLVVFVYDPTGRVADPREFEQRLSHERSGVTVRVIVAPWRS